ncbi:MAG: DMT family transporter [Propionicimonas sp.]|nr:DMT family transporter [Propionicimonas sp.]
MDTSAAPGALVLGVVIALIGTVFVSFGAQYQHRGVAKVEQITGRTASAGLNLAHLLRLLLRPSWLAGAVLLLVAFACQLGALAFAPLTVVQPVSAVSLVITTVLTARATGRPPTRGSLVSLAACLSGIAAFVTVAALFATDRAMNTTEALTVLAVLGVAAVVFVVLWLVLRRTPARVLLYILAGGTLYGFVAIMAKLALARLRAGDLGWLTWTCVAVLAAAALLGGYFVQTAYSSGPPDLVVAGLTVIDPMVAVLVGLLILGEGAAVPVWGLVVFAVAGTVAVWGVVSLTRTHPQVAVGRAPDQDAEG